jgi:hypothetical protein
LDEVGVILWEEGATQGQKDEAHGILETLCAIYPGYPWGVRVYDGGFFIRHLGYPQGWGMNCKHTTFSHSSSEMKRQIILMAGEWLERAKLKRGQNVYEDEPGYVEGVPERQQLPAEKEPVAAEVTAFAEETRTQARPQAIRQMMKDIKYGNGLS